MIEPIKPGDELFPYNITMVDGHERAELKSDWTEQKQIELDIRTIEYLLQFREKHGSKALINMIWGDSLRAQRFGTDIQKTRFRELLTLRESWIQTAQGVSGFVGRSSSDGSSCDGPSAGVSSGGKLKEFANSIASS